jgi:hypothetical protein
MAKFSLSDWANVAEIGAALGVIASLIFVGFELRSSTEATEAATREAINQTTFAFLSLSIDTSVLARASTKWRNGEELTALEIDQLVRQELVNFASIQFSYTEYLRGTHNLDSWRRYQNIAQEQITSYPYSKIMWERHGHSFTPEFQDLINGFLSD